MYRHIYFFLHCFCDRGRLDAIFTLIRRWEMRTTCLATQQRKKFLPEYMEQELKKGRNCLLIGSSISVLKKWKWTSISPSPVFASCEGISIDWIGMFHRQKHSWSSCLRKQLDSSSSCPRLLFLSPHSSSYHNRPSHQPCVSAGNIMIPQKNSPVSKINGWCAYLCLPGQLRVLWFHSIV